MVLVVLRSELRVILRKRHRKINDQGGTNSFLLAFDGIFRRNFQSICQHESERMVFAPHPCRPFPFISGGMDSSFVSGTSGTAVTAVPKIGYHFFNWSDGNTEYSRTGVANLLVFAFFGPAQDPATVRISQLPQVANTGGFLTYQFTEPAGVSGITYRAQWSATLGNDWQPVTDTGTAPGRLFSVPISGAKKFLRLSVEPSP
jgi:hypothetical protein